MKHRFLLGLLVATWAVSWPVIKVGIATVPPLWFAFFRYAIAAACLFTLLASRGALSLPPRADLPLVAVSGTLQMALYAALTGLALTALPPGRASVLAFSTPLWVVPLAAWRLGERIRPRVVAGVALGLGGIAAIAGPSLQARGGAELVAYVLLLGASLAWAISIVAVRGHRFMASPLALAPWQMLVAAVLLLPVAIVVDGSLPRLGPEGAASLLYVGPVATAFAYWAVVEVGRFLPAATLSMALLATPALGILISALWLGETVGVGLVAGAALVAVGIRCATGKRAAPTSAAPRTGGPCRRQCPTGRSR